MSIQRTAESALYSLEELYKAIDLSSQQQSAMSGNDSENLVQALCNLSQLINQTGMCDRTPIMTTNFDAKRFNRKKMKNFIGQHLNDNDEHRYMDSETVGPPSPPQSRKPYGECVLYHPIRIITTSADGPIMLNESDFVRKEEQYRKDHGHSQRELNIEGLLSVTIQIMIKLMVDEIMKSSVFRLLSYPLCSFL